MSTTVLYVVAGTTLGILQIGLGMWIGVWLMRIRRGNSESQSVDMRRARLLVEQVGRLTEGVTRDVRGHQQELQRFHDRVHDAQQQQDAPVTDMVVGVIAEVLSTNDRLHQRLAIAETQLQQQSTEIASHINRSMTDELTQLPNRRALDEELTQRLDRFRRNQVPFTLMLLDVDHFKSVNDRYGHVAGDVVLHAVGETTRGTLRKPDFVARYGGEEFAVILPYTAAQDAIRAARKVLAAVSSASTIVEDDTICVTVSIGLAEPQRLDREVDILARADEALYASKQDGRNCGHVHDGHLCVPLDGRLESADVCKNQRDFCDEEGQQLLDHEPSLSPSLAAACADLRNFADEQLTSAGEVGP